MNNWSLNELYEGYNDTFKKDLESLNTSIKDLDTISLNLNGKKDVEKWLNKLSIVEALAMRLGAYISLNIATNITDSESNQYEGQFYNIINNSVMPSTRFNKFLFENKDNFDLWCNESELIKEHRFILEETINNFAHQLSEKEENIISILSINGTNNWSKLQDYVTSNASGVVDGETLTLSSIRNLAYDADQDKRKKAYEVELELYKNIEDAAAFALNSIKGEVNNLTKLRGYESALEESLDKSRLSKESLDALLEAINKFLPKFREYLKHKAKRLGHENGLPWYDLFAPEGTSEKTYSIDEAHELLVNAFSTFSPELAKMTDDAFKNNWIDFYPKEGKVGGAFCYNLPIIKQSRILTNYGGSISDVITLAHELGHAYHGYLLQDNSILNTDYSMPVAETASTFNENIVLNAVLETADDETKLLLIENSLQDLTQIIVDILSRYKFESEVFEKRKDNFMFASELNDIMLQAQDETYGDGLDPNFKHPYMWICKGHYYNGGYNFYNFPYAFGGLFSLGLYAMYKKDKESFVPKYNNLLKSTAVKNCENVAKEVNVDITKPAFWELSLQEASDRIDQYITLTSK